MPPSISETPAIPTPTPQRRFAWPGDYYSTATPLPVLPRGVSYGCGAAAVVVLVIVFVGGAWLSSGGFTQFLDMAFGMTLSEMRGMYAKDVTDAQKKALETEIESLREHVRKGEIPPAKLQTVLQTMQKSMRDEKLTREEVDALIAASKEAQRLQGSKAHRRPPPAPDAPVSL